jgi:hypothetical protein
MRGRLDDGTYVFALEAFADTSIRSRPHIYREEMPVLETKAGASRFDTAFTTLGTEMTPQFITVMGQTLPRAQPVAYGASTQIAPRGGTVYVSTGERFEITSYDTAGRVTRMLRVGVARRAVEESDREKYRSRLREVLDLQMKNARFPPGFPQSEIQKLRDQGMRIIDSTVFAERVAAITQLIVEPNGTLWASLGAGLADTTRQWLVFSGDGKLLGKVTTPGLALFAVLDDRIVVRQEDPETGVVRLEVWGLRRTPAPTLR